MVFRINNNFTQKKIKKMEKTREIVSKFFLWSFEMMEKEEEEFPLGIQEIMENPIAVDKFNPTNEEANVQMLKIFDWWIENVYQQDKIEE